MVLLEVTHELVDIRLLAETEDRLALELADTLSRESQAATNVRKRVLAPVGQTITKLENRSLAVWKPIKKVHDIIAHDVLECFFNRSWIVIFDHRTELFAIFLVANHLESRGLPIRRAQCAKRVE